MLGFTSVTWSSPMLPKLSHLEDNPLGRKISPMENSVLATLPTIGSICGSAIYAFSTTKFGEKPLLTSLGFPPLISYATMAFFPNIYVYYISRLLCGIGMGGSLTILPVYIAELARANQRGFLGASLTIFIKIGMMIPYSLGPFIPFFWYHVLLAGVSVFYSIVFQFVGVESPYFLIDKDPVKAERIAIQLRKPEHVTEYLNEIWNGNKVKSSGTFKDIIKSKALRRSLIIGLGLFTFMQFTGFSVIMTYSQTIFELSGSKLSPEICSIITGMIPILTIGITTRIADKFSRKTMLYASNLGVSLTLIPLGAYFYLKNKGYDMESLSILPLILLITYFVSFNIGVSFIPAILLGELFPAKVKGIAVSFVMIYNSSIKALITLLFNYCTQQLGLGTIFWIFAVFTFTSIIFVKIFLIETKGRTLQEIQNVLNSC